jgi:hypothetical protein
VLKKLDSSPSYQKAYENLTELNLHDDDEFFRYKMQVREDKRLRLPAIREVKSSRTSSNPFLLSPVTPFQFGEMSSRSDGSLSANSEYHSGGKYLTADVVNPYGFNFGEDESPQLSRRGSSRRPSSVFSSDNSMAEMLTKLQNTMLSPPIVEYKTRRASTLVKSELVKSILSRRESDLPPLEVKESVTSKEFFRRGSRRQSLGWSPAPPISFTVPVFITETSIAVPGTKLTLKKLMKKIVNVFHFFRFMSKCLKNKIERGWEFDIRCVKSINKIRMPLKTYRIASMARREHYFMVHLVIF